LILTSAELDNLKKSTKVEKRPSVFQSQT